MENKLETQLEILNDLLVLLLLKSGVSYEAIAEVTRSNPKTLRNRFSISKLVRKEE